MNEQERKAWERLVSIAQKEYKPRSTIWNPEHLAVLAAYAELKRLREAVEWICELLRREGNIAESNSRAMYFYQMEEELRRRAKEGK